MIDEFEYKRMKKEFTERYDWVSLEGAIKYMKKHYPQASHGQMIKCYYEVYPVDLYGR